MEIIKNMTGKLTNAQLEIINAFAIDMEAEELEAFKSWVLEFKIKRLQTHLDKVWEEKGIHPDDLLKEQISKWV
jgi:hypothetical protein